MIRVKISDNAFPKWPLIRQTPQASGIWGNCQFFVNQEIDECDVWVVYNSLKQKETVRCSADNIILITTEPPSVEQYRPEFLDQFSKIITCHRDLQSKHAQVVYRQQGLPWHVGKTQVGRKDYQFSSRYDYDELKSMKSFHKTKEISVITSNKQLTEGHKQRIQFVEKLKQHFGDRLDVFGRGIRDVDDKWDAIGEYKYHIVIENSSFPDYWTEKLSDTYLAGTYPLYYGCPNIADYFSKEAVTPIDIHDAQQSIRKIEDCINGEKYETAMSEIVQARELVLDKYNLFPMIEAFVQDHVKNQPPNKKEKVRLRPGKYWDSIRCRVNSLFGSDI